MSLSMYCLILNWQQSRRKSKRERRTKAGKEGGSREKKNKEDNARDRRYSNAGKDYISVTVVMR